MELTDLEKNANKIIKHYSHLTQKELILKIANILDIEDYHAQQLINKLTKLTSQVTSQENPRKNKIQVRLWINPDEYDKLLDNELITQIKQRGDLLC